MAVNGALNIFLFLFKKSVTLKLVSLIDISSLQVCLWRPKYVTRKDIVIIFMWQNKQWSQNGWQLLWMCPITIWLFLVLPYCLKPLAFIVWL